MKISNEDQLSYDFPSMNHKSHEFEIIDLSFVVSYFDLSEHCRTFSSASSPHYELFSSRSIRTSFS